MPDGVRLHARIWRPEDSLDRPVPALLEYLPYRLDDWTAPRDSERHPYYAGHGYASVRVDIRGTGSSDGHFVDEYSPQELDDGVSVILWLADQAWCSGQVGMFGISWGGFNALQLAALAPEPLKAIVTVCSTDDRYDNDVHYMGGAVLAIDMSAWAGTMLAFNARPPRPEVVGERWVGQWRDRLEDTQPMAPVWLAHQERDEYWRRGSVCEDYSSIRAAVLAVGGWHDPYRDTVFRLAQNLTVPVRGIVGPWSHQYPDRELAPGPSIGFLQETVRWWDRWLKGAQNRVEDEPLLRAFVMDAERPATYYPERQGRWVGMGEWPPAAGQDTELALAGAACSGVVGQDATVIVRTPQHTGADAGRFFPFGNATDLPSDQRADDGRSVTLTFSPLPERLEVLGNPRVHLRLACDRPQGTIVVRLCDVAPDGASTLITRGVLNLNKRNGRERNDQMPVDEMVDVQIDLASIGYAVPAGHTLRLALSSTYWPWIWPHPQEATLRVDLGASALSLPTLTGHVEQVSFEDPEQSRPLPVGPLPEKHGDVDPAVVAPAERLLTHDVASGEWTLEVDPGYGGSRRYPDGLEFREHSRETYRIREGDPLSATATSAWAITLTKDGWRAHVDTRQEITADADDFVVRASVTAHATTDGKEQLVAERTWEERVPRTSA
ncbi:CocE/NonD family hydrolase [Ornithinimicrobium avium]|uniref:CocE/NonD family hydrolase n=2 Tax=Ornithinimicrobium avium TaxID=2283195 RepID=A0A345NSV6_9MICO|nr:CocE/NonD family hydrolase [Ornithinimicrobium avium]